MSMPMSGKRNTTIQDISVSDIVGYMMTYLDTIGAYGLLGDLTAGPQLYFQVSVIKDSSYICASTQIYSGGVYILKTRMSRTNMIKPTMPPPVP